jgi:D-glycero-D-manno-heptose 1,7-bisphosphate phosphatase
MSSSRVMNPRPAIFLDRDGVVIEDVHYLASPEQVELVPGSADAIAALNRAGWPVVVVTNQSGVARGLFAAEMVDAVHAHLSALLAGYGARVEAYYFCPHYPTADVESYRVDCTCRKPKPGMLLRAAADLGLDLDRSWMIGDRASDLEAGAAASADATVLDRSRLNLEVVASDLADAVAKCGLAQRVKQVA